jgi:hypothetical protein
MGLRAGAGAQGKGKGARLEHGNDSAMIRGRGGGCSGVRRLEWMGSERVLQEGR